MISSARLFSQHLSFAVSKTSLKISLKTVTIAAFSIAVVLAGQISSAQQLPLAPEPQISASQPQEQQEIAALEDPTSFSSSAMPAFAPMASYSLSRPVALKPEKVVDSKFLLLNGLHLGLAALDVELTQHCIANNQCHEGNPLMPSSQAAQWSVDLSYVALGTIASYWKKKHKSSHWWFAPTAGISAHTVGVASGLSHY